MMCDIPREAFKKELSDSRYKLLDEYDPIYVDVDGTLLIWPEPNPGRRKFGANPIINTKVQRFLFEIKRYNPKVRVYLWSANGAEHALDAMWGCGLEKVVDDCLTKPRLYIDDYFKWFDDRIKLTPELKRHK